MYIYLCEFLLQRSVRLTPTSMLYAGKQQDGAHILKSAQYLHKELPVRIAHRIQGFRTLPFIVGCNSTILKIHEMYIRAFHILHEHPPVTDHESEEKYTEALKSLLDDHQNVVTMLAEGFSECRRHIKDESMIKGFLDRMLKSRLGIRMLVEHHVALHDEMPNHVGIIDVNFSPRSLIERKAEFVRHICQSKYGFAPIVKLNGHLNAKFPYIPAPLDYMLGELLKNAFRATTESHLGNGNNAPDIVITIANNEQDFNIRISDRGGGIPHDIVDKVFHYNFTTAGESMEQQHDNYLFGEITSPSHMSGDSPGKMHGYGFGLPIAKSYAEFLGGSLELQTMQGIGTDVFIRLRHIDGKYDSYRI
ncbi:hypothetical protein FSP39_010860 [Pinctada imbricata]|uniref:Protein-serine/threonine kinase n=1 Tax=Pinctada imbricata TaxID=66713 RepID=A0AA88XF91_PINIB|nr:hypothetical protein FSP39_010860 [Pinctada imbricata]